MRTTPPSAGASPAPSAPDARSEHEIQMICTDDGPSTVNSGDSTRAAQQRAQGMPCAVGEAA